MSDEDLSSVEQFHAVDEINSSRPPSVASNRPLLRDRTMENMSIEQGIGPYSHTDAQANHQITTIKHGYFLRSRGADVYDNGEGNENKGVKNDYDAEGRHEVSDRAFAARNTAARDYDLTRGMAENVRTLRARDKTTVREPISLTFDPAHVTLGGNRLSQYSLVASTAGRRDATDRSTTYFAHVDSRPRVNEVEYHQSEVIPPKPFIPIETQRQMCANDYELHERVRTSQFADCAADDDQQVNVCRLTDLPDDNRRPKLTPRSEFVNGHQAGVSSGVTYKKQPCEKGDRATLLYLQRRTSG